MKENHRIEPLVGQSRGGHELGSGFLQDLVRLVGFPFVHEHGRFEDVGLEFILEHLRIGEQMAGQERIGLGNAAMAEVECGFPYCFE